MRTRRTPQPGAGGCVQAVSRDAAAEYEPTSRGPQNATSQISDPIRLCTAPSLAVARAHGRARPAGRRVSVAVAVVDGRGPSLPGPLRPRRPRGDAERDHRPWAPTRSGSRSSGTRSRRDPSANSQPSFDATDPGAYPGFEPYDDLVRARTAQGSARHDHARPRRAATGRPPVGAAATTRSTRVTSPTSRARSALATRAPTPACPRSRCWSIWNEPNHVFFIKPRSQAPRVYRRLVQRGLPALKAAVPGARVLVGELAPVGTATKVIGPLRFLQQWLCLDNELQAPARRKAARGRLQRVQARRPPTASRTTPTARPAPSSERRDIVNMVGDPAPREGARQGRAGGPDQPRPRHLQHRVRDTRRTRPTRSSPPRRAARPRS